MVLGVPGTRPYLLIPHSPRLVLGPPVGSEGTRICTLACQAPLPLFRQDLVSWGWGTLGGGTSEVPP